MLIYPQGQFTIPKEFQDGLVAAYNGQHNGDTVIDISGNGNNGTQNGGVTFSRYNGANMMSFDGSDDKVTISGDGSSVTNYDNDYSRIGIVSTNKNDERQIIVCGHGTRNCVLALYEDGVFANWIYDGESHIAKGNTSIEIGKKYFVCGTRSKTNGLKIYVNGYLDGEDSFTGDGDSVNSTDRIGCYNNTDSNFFDGNIYLVLIYNKALSPKQIQKMYDYFRQFYY